ncbi:MAG: hypothetical protein MJ180_03700 [Candidatus Gastranaerophilales bacterium]|nr:hypothetical protein [Candidatus Gastranaerophilales bacterium]
MKNPIFYFLIIASLFMSAYKFPDKLPAPLDFDTYTFDRVKFGQTSVNEFAYIAPEYQKPQTEGVYTIYQEKDLDNIYKGLRIGFKENFLDWIELEFAVPQSFNKMKQAYGEPKSLNANYSTKYNYHDYGYFNLVTDKNNASVFAVTLYGESDFNPSIANVVKKLPDFKSFNFINELIPGRMMEENFTSSYPDFPFSASDNENAGKTYTIPAKYLKHNHYYSNVDLVFSNGILSFVNLTPKGLSIMQIKQTYGEGTETKSSKQNIYFWEYPNFVATFDKNTNKVLNVGIVGAD